MATDQVIIRYHTPSLEKTMTKRRSKKVPKSKSRDGARFGSGENQDTKVGGPGFSHGLCDLSDPKKSMKGLRFSVFRRKNHLGWEIFWWFVIALQIIHFRWLNHWFLFIKTSDCKISNISTQLVRSKKNHVRVEALTQPKKWCGQPRKFCAANFPLLSTSSLHQSQQPAVSRHVLDRPWSNHFWFSEPFNVDGS